VSDGSDLLCDWIVSGPAHAVLETNGSSIVIVFSREATYLVNVTVFNNVSSTSAYVEVSSRLVSCSPPSVELVGDARRSELRSRSIRIETVVSGDCLEYRLRHEWYIWNGDCVDEEPDGGLPQLVLTDAPTLFLSARSLDYGDFCVVFRSCFYKAPGCNNVSVHLEIKASPLRALISGGDARSIVVSEKIIFDGSASYDPDIEKDASSLLFFNWTCQVVFYCCYYYSKDFSDAVTIDCRGSTLQKRMRCS